MMENPYYLASLKLSGWLSKTGQYTTDIKEARLFNHMEALEFSRKHKEAGRVLVPVAKADMDWI